MQDIVSAAELQSTYQTAAGIREDRISKDKTGYVSRCIDSINNALLEAASRGESYVDRSVEQWAYAQVTQPFIKEGFHIKIYYSYKDTDPQRYTVPDEGKRYCSCYQVRFYIVPPKEPLLVRFWKAIKGRR